jgi:hypothetical protein
LLHQHIGKLSHQHIKTCNLLAGFPLAYYGLSALPVTDQFITTGEIKFFIYPAGDSFAAKSVNEKNTIYPFAAGSLYLPECANRQNKI